MISVAHAQEASLNTVGATAGFSQADLLTIIGNIINVFLGLLGVVLLLLLLYAGFLWMTSAGNEEIITKAKNIIKSAIIGLIICLAAFAIATFVINALMQATGLGGDDADNPPATEAFSDSLGSGGIEDHYPGRNASDIARNTKIIVTFKNQIYLSSFIAGYDTGSEPRDVSDDIAPATANITDAFDLTCVDQDGEETNYASSDVTVSFTDDLKTFVFDPPVMGSAVAPTDCTVVLDRGILNVDGVRVLDENYEWSFQVSTELDTTPPTIESVVPGDGASGYGRNITIQITFSEAVDPTTASGTYDAIDGGFTKLQTLADPEETGTFSPLSGTFDISSGYTIVEFTPADACGTNSCGEIIYCLPGPSSSESTEEEIRLNILAADTTTPPEADVPYTGVADLAGNSLDGGSGPGTDYSEEFTVTDEIVLTPPSIESVAPTVLENNVATDQDVVIIWDTLMRASTMTNSTVGILANPDHDMWYQSVMDSLDAAGADAGASGQDPTHTQLTVLHGTFLDSEDDDPSTGGVDESLTGTQLYAPVLPDDIQSLYQNCFYPASSNVCTGTANEPHCCNDVSSAGGFDGTNFRCLQ